ncbi:MAG: sugar ABC transporter permease [Lachnospiraceae bacterium]|nr:sugar ABC transporter permease [Lachnospiraceae bacterium]
MAATRSKKSKVVSYTKWGYIFLIPFFLVYFAFQIIPLVSTIYNSFFENYLSGLNQIGPNFVGLDNYVELIKTGDLLKYTGNTLIMWIAGFIPQILISLLLAVWFADTGCKLKGEGFFKTVIYMPNLIMASAMAMLFFTVFSNIGPVNQMLKGMGIIDNPYVFLDHTKSAIALVGTMNFLMWFGNTTILLMAGIMGIDTSLFEAAQVDGANGSQTFFSITMPLLKPIFVYVLLTSLVGGIQMFDIPQILTSGEGTPNRTTMTLIMYLNKHLFSKNYGMAGALSVMLFIVTAILSLIVYRVTVQPDEY